MSRRRRARSARRDPTAVANACDREPRADTTLYEAVPQRIRTCDPWNDPGPAGIASDFGETRIHLEHHGITMIGARKSIGSAGTIHDCLWGVDGDLSNPSHSESTTGDLKLTMRANSTSCRRLSTSVRSRSKSVDTGRIRPPRHRSHVGTPRGASASVHMGFQHWLTFS